MNGGGMTDWEPVGEGDDCPSCDHGELIDCSTNFTRRLNCMLCDYQVEP